MCIMHATSGGGGGGNANALFHEGVGYYTFPLDHYMYALVQSDI